MISMSTLIPHPLDGPVERGQLIHDACGIVLLPRYSRTFAHSDTLTFQSFLSKL